MDSLRPRLARGSAWLTVSRTCVNILQAISTLALARLLLPTDVGVVMVALTMLSILTALTNLSLGSALVQHRNPTDDHVNTVWTLGVARGITLAAVFALAAIPASIIYADPRLPMVMLALSLGVVISGLSNPRLSLLTRELLYGRQVLIQVAGKATSVGVSLTIAIVYKSYWALVLGGLAGQSLTVVLSYAMLRYRPRLSLHHLRELFAFSGWLTLAQLVTTINWSLDHLLVGAWLGSAAMAYYGVGNMIALIPTREAIAPLTGALFPAFSAIADNRARLQKAYQAVQSFAVAVTLPCGVGTALVAEPLVRLFLGEQWLDSILVIQVLASIFAIQTIGTAAESIAMATGHTKFLFRRDLQAAAIRMPAIAAGLFLYGIPGLLAARVCTGLLLIPLNLDVIRKTTGLGFLTQLGPNLRSLAAVAIMAAAVWSADRMLSLPLDIPGQAARLAGLVAVGAVTYSAAHWLIWRAIGRPEGPEGEVLRAVALFRRTTGVYWRKWFSGVARKSS